MKFITAADMNSPMGLHNVMSRMAEKNDLKQKQERAGQIARVFLETASSMPEDMQGDTNALFEAVKDKIPKGATESEIMTGLKFADYVYERQSNRKQNKRDDMVFDQSQEDRSTLQMEKKTNDADVNLLARYMGGDDSTGGDAYSVPMTEKDYVKSMSGKGAIGLLNYKAGNEAAKQKALLDAEKRKEESDYKQAQIGELNRRGKGEDKKYSSQELAIKKLGHVNNSTKGMEDILKPEEYQARRKAAADEFDSALGLIPQNNVGQRGITDPEEAKSLLERIFGKNKPAPAEPPPRQPKPVQRRAITPQVEIPQEVIESQSMPRAAGGFNEDLPQNITKLPKLSGRADKSKTIQQITGKRYLGEPLRFSNSTESQAVKYSQQLDQAGIDHDVKFDPRTNQITISIKD